MYEVRYHSPRIKLDGVESRVVDITHASKGGK